MPKSALRSDVLRMTLTATFVACMLASEHDARAADLAQLDKLTPAGAEKEGNKDKTIPAWQGAEASLPGWEWGKDRREFWKHKGDKPLFAIDASNVDKHADKLSPGQVAMIKQTKGYTMDVYPTHRTCGVPDFVASNTRKNLNTAKLNEGGWGINEAIVPGFPFPIPSNGAEAMWNSKLRYRGIGLEYKNLVTTVSPRRGGSEWIKAAQEFTAYMPWGAKGSAQLSSLPPYEYQGYFTYNSPPALAGQALSISFFLNQPGSEGFYYFPGQRRVRRMPSYAYDAPQIGMENQYTNDEPFMFNGPIDRFDWKLIGKKEIYVLYNAFGANDFKGKFDDIAKPEFISASHRRYELHRVWVVEASVKQGTRHTTPKRTYYLDEDSWNIVLGEDYDAQGKLAKVREGFLVPVYETGTCDASAFVQYNLNEGRYVFDMHAAGSGSDIRWVTEPKGPRFKSDFYTADNLRAISER